MQLKPIEDQVIVITGASSGIGLATARLAARLGAKLALGARSEQTLSEVVEQMCGTGGNALYRRTDVSRREDLEQLAEAALQTYGRIDTWINNAGVSIYGKLEEINERESRRLFDVNFWGVVNGSLIAVRALGESGGALINLGSEVSDAVVPLQGMYSASKHAVKGFTDALRVELQATGRGHISVTLIQPTAVDTPYPEHARNYMDKQPKLPDPEIEPEVVAEAILRAATRPMRDVRVGMMAKINTNMFKLVPALADRMARKQIDRQHYDVEPRDRAGTLFKACESGRERGHDPASRLRT